MRTNECFFSYFQSFSFGISFRAFPIIFPGVVPEITPRSIHGLSSRSCFGISTKVSLDFPGRISGFELELLPRHLLQLFLRNTSWKSCLSSSLDSYRRSLRNFIWRFPWSRSQRFLRDFFPYFPGVFIGTILELFTRNFQRYIKRYFDINYSKIFWNELLEQF